MAQKDQDEIKRLSLLETELKEQSEGMVGKLSHQKSMVKKRLELQSTFIENFNPSENPTFQLECRLDVIEKLEQEFQKLNETILDYVDIADPTTAEYLVNEQNDFFDIICRVKGTMKSVIAANNSHHERREQPRRSELPGAPEIMKLPPIPIPVFNGEVKEWISFRDTFTALVGCQRMNEVAKLHYLRESLKNGEAMKLISEIEPSDDAFQIAWELLKKRYDNKKVIIDCHIQELFKLKSVTSENSTELWKLIENCSKQLKALRALGEPVDQWNTLIIHMIKFRLDDETKKLWEAESLAVNKMLSWEDMETFLAKRCRVLESFESSKRKVKSTKPIAERKVALVSGTSKGDNRKCEFCDYDHDIDKCRKFENAHYKEKLDTIKKKGLCFRCLARGHMATNCEKKCETCQGNHHKLIHIEKEKKTDNKPEESETKAETKQAMTTTTSVLVAENEAEEVLLMTAKIKMRNVNGDWIEVRALLDGASQSNFCSEKLFQKLGFDPKITNISVKGICSSTGATNKKFLTSVKSRFTEFERKLQFLVIPEIIETSPVRNLDLSKWRIPEDIKTTLADEECLKSTNIDILLGVHVFLECLVMEQRDIGKDFPLFQNTAFGWVVGGSFYGKPANTKKVRVYATCICNIDDEIKKFWEIENWEPLKKLTTEEKECENHFVKTYKRLDNGKFMVRLPFKRNPEELGDSKKIAIKRLLSTERRLEKDSNLKEQYVKFMREYESMCHMTRINEPSPEEKIYVMPHHPVFKPDSTTTKVRVVFNASEKTSSGETLNELQMIGPTVQDELFNIVIRERKHPIALSADVEKMYRMILVHEDDRKYQMIVWRENTNEDLKYFQLNTVTYGTSAAPFLSTRVLKQLATDSREKYPLAAAAIKDFYIDDYIGGANSIEEARELQKELILMFKSAGMNLRKWCSNNQELLKHLKPEDLENPHCLEETAINETIKTLGIIWNPTTDMYGFNIDRNPDKVTTKRQLLSRILRLFDPIGFLSPLIVSARLMMQELWLLKTGWDENIPTEMIDQWTKYETNLEEVKSIQVKRCVIPNNKPLKIELHGFSDASEKAYGACCYIRVIAENEIHVNLLCSKFRVAPLKKRSLPQLELCGAHLLTKLVEKVKKALEMKFDETYLWTDSTIVLTWIETPSYKLKTFVSNRVSEIQETTENDHWRHVTSKKNPADLLSRGTTCVELQSSNLWWNGPDFLKTNIEDWPQWKRDNSQLSEIPELKVEKTVLVNVKMDLSHLMERYSSVTKLQRLIAYWMRFINNISKKKTQKFTGFLKQCEIQEALRAIIRWDQRNYFPKEHRQLRNNEVIDPKSKIKSLNPFLDSHGIIRVGGRIKESTLPFEAKHQILLSKDSDLTKKMIVEKHMELGHAGPQTVLYSMRQQYWPVHGRQLIRLLLKNWVTCTRVNPKKVEQFMGNLPAERVQLCHPFYSSGVDYAGPFMIKEIGVRSKRLFKAWVAVFVCLATKCVHLELVQDLTTASFIQALTRFSSRRGKPKSIHSDNATNFVGANNELKNLREFLNDKKNHEKIDRYCSNNGIQWHFIPPRSPSMGGEWEAAVKSFKYHLNRIVGNTTLTVLEMETVLCKIEAILNSRPLFQESTDPNDLTAITPGHFIIGRPLTAIPEMDVYDINENRLARYQKIQQASQHFWKRFQQDYLNSLQVRSKGYKQQIEFKIGQLVLLRDENTKPLLWKLARIVELHPGSDNIVRVVTVRTPDGSYKRAVNKLCPLPIETEQFQGLLDVKESPLGPVVESVVC